MPDIHQEIAEIRADLARLRAERAEVYAQGFKHGAGHILGALQESIEASGWPPPLKEVFATWIGKARVQIDQALGKRAVGGAPN